MEAAAHGHSNIGIPRGVGEEFSEADRGKHFGRDADDPETPSSAQGVAAGVLFCAPDGAVLLLLRSDAEPNYGGYWALPGGKGDEDETPLECALREASEEIGDASRHAWVGEPTVLSEVDTPNGFVYTTFAQPTRYRFEPELNAEHSGFGWFDPSRPPTPLHPAVEKLLKSMTDVKKPTATDSYALDRASVRREDDDGHLHVERTPISKANVCEYYGREIPDGVEKLRLEPDRLYKLWRHPEELEKAASSFAGKPLLHVHTPVSADEHPREKVVGTIGDEVKFDAPYLTAPLHVWDGDAIDRIKSDQQREISCGYRYRAYMTPGRTPEGEAYDGVMRDIAGNHVALVEEGRAGPDVVVGDSASKKTRYDVTKIARDAASGKLDEKEQSVANRTPKEREETPASVFLEPGSRKYPVKTKQSGEWKYDRDLLLAAARRARMNDNESLAARADAIRKREFSGAQDSKFEESKHPRAENGQFGTNSTHSSGPLKLDLHKPFGPQFVSKGMSKEDVESFLKNSKYNDAQKIRIRSSYERALKKFGTKKGAEDSRSKELSMAMKKGQSRKAAAAEGALVAYLLPKLGQDAKIDFRALTRGVTDDNFSAKKGLIASRVRSATKGQLAQDASVGDLAELLDALEAHEDLVEDAETTEPSAGPPNGAEESSKERLRKLIGDKLSPEDMEACDAMLADWKDEDQSAMDEEDEEAEDEEKDEAMDEDEEKDEKVDKKAMDAAIRASNDALREQLRREQRDTLEALRVVRPHVGDLSNLALDSAEAVYRTTLKMRGVKDHDKLPVAALRPIVDNLQTPGAAPSQTPTMAADSAKAAEGFLSRFPQAADRAVA